ncbi:hypothetical protein RHMOL_Rhmol06G0153100 [Rhododendron molle]|uniref:Uncharacterized protein n=1 Tax=Rhododendron molle TaxID=49168 RepID=A0ACC0NCG0_RHOML|nr:hypothetical protein RHMOL_Rhmol06G0153100 [Rhododendron molle]
MTTRELESTKMEANESFADFVKRWRAKVVLMTKRPSEKDQLRIISRNLQPDYARHLVLTQASANFETFFDSDLAIEDALQSGILSKGESSNLPKAKPRTYSGNTNALFGGRTYSNTTTSGTNTTSSNTNNHISDVNQDLIDEGTLQAPPPPSQKPNILSNSMPNHKAVPHISQISLSSAEINPNSTTFDPTGQIIPTSQPRPVVSSPPEPCAEVSYICVEEGQLTDTNVPLEWLQNGAFVLSASIGDLCHQSIPAVQLNSASSLNSPYFNATDLNPSPSLADRFQSHVPPPEIDMQAVGWAMADNMDYATPLINEWSGLELDGFPQQPEYFPFDQAWYDGKMADHEAAMLDPLDGFSLNMLFRQAEPFVPEEKYNWDPEPIWQDPMDLDPNPLQGYATPDYVIHYMEDDLIQEDPRVLGDHISTFSSVFYSVCDADHNPCSYITNEEFPRPEVPYPSNRDCSIMVTDLIPPANLWDVDEVVDIQVGTKVWAINRSLAEGGLWDVPFVANPEPVIEVAAVTDLSFWDSLLMKDLAEDLGLDMEVLKSATATDKGKHKLGEVPTDLWDVNEDPQLEWIPAAIPIWGLICSSCEHRQKLCHALSRREIQADITPEAMVSLILPPTSKHTVVFTDKDLPVEGVDHNRPLHISVKCRGLWVSTVLIDNGSAINVCPMRVACRLGLAKKDFAPSSLAVKAYDRTCCMVEGTLMLKLDAEGFGMDVEFHVIDIPATFNLLLGKPWLHRSDIMVVPSTFHQKVILGLPIGTLTICGDSGIRPLKEDGTPVLGILHGKEDVDLGGFLFDSFGSVLAINVDRDFIISSVAMDIMRRMSFFSGLGLGIRQQGVLEFPPFPSCEGRFGLGDEEPARTEFNRKLNKPKLKTDWLGTFDHGSLELMFHEFSQVGLAEEAEEVEVLMLGPDALKDPTSLIVEANGSLKNCIFKPCLTCIDDTSESESESTFESESESSESSKSSSKASGPSTS